MSKVLVLYYSSYGHIEKMAGAVAEGAREGGAEVTIKRVPELVPEEVAKKSGFKLDQAAPIATVDELADYDAIIIGVPTRFGNMPAQMKSFLDQTGGLWIEGQAGRQGRQRLYVDRRRSTAARRARSFPPTPSCSITAWSSSACPMRSRARRGSTKSPAARPTAPARSPAATARGSPPRTNSPARASRAGTSPASPPSSRLDRSGAGMTARAGLSCRRPACWRHWCSARSMTTITRETGGTA